MGGGGSKADGRTISIMSNEICSNNNQFSSESIGDFGCRIESDDSLNIQNVFAVNEKYSFCGSPYVV